MAQTQIVELIDDINGGPAHQTVEFALDGKPLEIDVSDDNAARLREVLAPYIVKARHVGGRRPKRTRIAAGADALEQRRASMPKRGRGKNTVPPAPLPQFSESTTDKPKRTSLRPDAASVREWARGQGIPLNARGRIPQDVVDQFLAASKSTRRR
jgi:hypothetical protein